jgi:hypothetical protein
LAKFNRNRAMLSWIWMMDLMNWLVVDSEVLRH